MLKYLSVSSGLLCALVYGLLPTSARALPSYATQTGYACSQCHTVAFGPQLTPLGQSFKLNGYLWAEGDAKAPPLAAFLLTSYTHTQAEQPGGAGTYFNPNNNSAPDQISLFYAGKIAGHFGAFIQGTYDGVNRLFHWDNLDIRYSDKTKLGSTKLVYGFSLNNNPTVQDIWNTTPAWAFPYVSSALVPTPAAGTVIENGLAQQVYGLTGYVMINNMAYVELGGYRMLPAHIQNGLGIDPGGQDTLRGVAPYWRLALQKQFGPHYASLGAFGMSGRTQPGGDGSAGADRFVDFGYDASYQYNADSPHVFSANLTYVHEMRKQQASLALGTVGNGSNDINTLRFNAGYVFRQTYSISGGPFLIRGGSDTTLYAPNPIGGSASGSPNSTGYIGQIEYIPFGKKDSLWAPFLNARLGLQYTYYTEFNGDHQNYDGNGRNAHDNNTVYLFLWLAV